MDIVVVETVYWWRTMADGGLYMAEDVTHKELENDKTNREEEENGDAELNFLISLNEENEATTTK